MRFLLALGRTLVLIRHFLIVLVISIFYYPCIVLVFNDDYSIEVSLSQKDCVALFFVQSVNKYFRSKHEFRFPASGSEFQPSSPTTSRLDTRAPPSDRKVASDPTRAGRF